jgi:hypothetical protein
MPRATRRSPTPFDPAPLPGRDPGLWRVLRNQGPLVGEPSGTDLALMNRRLKKRDLLKNPA